MISLPLILREFNDNDRFVADGLATVPFDVDVLSADADDGASSLEPIDRMRPIEMRLRTRSTLSQFNPVTGFHTRGGK
jgi:hypothetical protein